MGLPGRKARATIAVTLAPAMQSPAAMIPALLLLFAAAQPSPAELSGHYGLLLRVPITSDFPVVGEVEAVYESLHLVRLEPGGTSHLVQRERMCSVSIDEDLSMFDLHISPRAVSTLPESRANAALVERDGRVFYEVKLQQRHLGMSPSAGDLPSSPLDAHVRDTDGDGHPGLTLGLTTPVGGVDVYIVQRDQAVLTGEVKGSGLVEGKVQVLRLEQRVIGTKPSLTDKLDLSMAPRADASFSLFRVPDGATCDELSTRWAAHLDSARRFAAREKEEEPLRFGQLHEDRPEGGFPSETWAAP